jgi:hypothetical protein
MLNITEYKVLGKLPDPFIFDDGTPVKTKADWEKRRKEIYKTAIELQYGTMPPKPEVFKVEKLYLGGKGRSNIYLITAGTKEKTVSFRMRLHLPSNEQRAKYGNVNPPVIVDGDLSFCYAMDTAYLNTALDEGIQWAFFDRTELAHDILNEGRGQGALYEVYPEYTFGALGAWAWGYSRCVDALELIGLSDMSCVVFTGHSRGGKTAALAGVLDERAAIVNPNETCAGACGCYRVHMKASYLGSEVKRSETLADLLFHFDYWMGPDLHEYATREEDLPFDEHMMKALVAPRTLFISEAAGDIWANPIGSWQTTMAAKEVFRFLDVEDELFWYFRPGVHYHDLNDIQMLVNIILQKKKGAKADDRFSQLPFKEPELIFDWRAPENA